MEIFYREKDLEVFGYGACKVKPLNEDNEFRLSQIPASQLQIMKIKDERQESPIYLAEQKISSSVKKYYKIIGCEYPEDYEDYNNKALGIVWWRGGDNFYNFFTKQRWYSVRENINSKIALNTLNSEKINNGNNNNGILLINKEQVGMQPPNQYINDNETNEETANQIAKLTNAQIVANELKANRGGTAVFYEESNNPMSMDYVNISENNYSYLSELSADCDNEVMSALGIPRERYMFTDAKEGQGSKKTETVWEIYTGAVERNQMSLEQDSLLLIKYVYPDLFNLNIDIESPLFSEIKESMADFFKGLFLSGIIPLGKCIECISPYISEIKPEDYNLTDPIMTMHLYNGKPLSDYDITPDDQTVIDSIMNIGKVEGVT